MIKVLHIITGLKTGGAERFLARLTERIGPDFESVVVSLADRGTLGDRIEAGGARLYTLHMNRLWPGPLGLLRLPGILRREKPAIIQSWLYHADLIAYLARRFTARRSRVLWNIRNSNLDITRFSWLHRLLFAALVRFSRDMDDVVTNSRAGQAFHEARGYRPRHWHYIPNGFDTQSWKPDAQARDRLRREWQIPDDAFVFGHVARYDPQKGHLHLIAAAAEFLRSADAPLACFVLAGRGVDANNRELSEALDRAGVRQYFRLLGERSDVAALNAACDLALSSSGFGEGFPNTIGEAMACGVPCLATDTGDTAFLIGDTGTLVPPGDTTKLAEAMAFWTHMPAAQRRAFGQAARRRIQADFSLEKVVESYSALYRFILT